MTKVAIVYVGNKPFARDNVAHSGATWQGMGDTQFVTPAQAKLLLKYPDQWALEDEGDQAKVDSPVMLDSQDADGEDVQVEESALSKPLEKMTRPELKAYAFKTFGKHIDARQPAKQMLDLIELWQREGA